MNLLSKLLMGSPEARHTDAQKLMRQLLPEGYPLANPVFETAYVARWKPDDWTKTWEIAVERTGGPLDPLSSGISRWISAVEIQEVGECVYLIPDDFRSAEGDFQFFAQAGEVHGRIRFSGPMMDGRLASVSEVLFEADLHCVEAGCGSDQDCNKWCNDCRCAPVLVGLGGVKGLACWCSTHSAPR